MNDFQEQQPEADDERLLREAMSALKRIEPPLEARLSNRRAVAKALEELYAVSPTTHQAWWRRSVEVPVPLVAAIGLLMAMLLYSSFQSGRELAKEVATDPSRPDVKTKVQPSEKPFAAKSKPESLAKWKQFQSEVYLCGVGQVSSEAYYSVEDQNHE